MTDRFSLASAFAAARAGETARWVGDLLESPGNDNPVLAAALARAPHVWIGPLRVELSSLVRLAGPEPDALCPVEEDEWEDDVTAIEDRLDDGWEPAPLLAELRDGELLLQDGNHRYDALVRAGETHGWVLVLCDDAAAADELASRHPDAHVVGRVELESQS